MYTYETLQSKSIYDLRRTLRSLGGAPGGDGKEKIISTILSIQDNKIVPKRSSRGRKPLESKSPDYESLCDGGEVNNDSSEVLLPDPLSPNMALSDVAKASEGATAEAEGVFELCPDGYGFLRAENYECTSKDVFVSRPLAKQYGLRKGDFVVGTCAKMRDSGAAALKFVYSINGENAMNFDKTARPQFDDLTARYPDEKFVLERKDDETDLSIRSMDIFCPIGKGQRGLIVAPPKAGKTTLLKKIANSLGKNYPETHLITLLIDERPEEVTDIKESVTGEVVYSTFDETSEHHIRVAELVMQRAKRLVETGKDVVILLDSLTKLARAYNSSLPSSGKTLSGGIDPTALQPPKKFFGAARNIENGGSLTIIATVLVETGSRMDDVIYEEFKGTGNMELHLSRQLSERRIFPAIDFYKSGTRKDELLLTKPELECAYLLRRFLAEDRNASENILDAMSKCENNAEFVKKSPVFIKLTSR